MGWYYLQICLVSLTSKPFLYNIYISASGYSVMDKLNGPLSKKTYVCVVFDWFRTNSRSFLGMCFNISYLSSVFDIFGIVIYLQQIIWAVGAREKRELVHPFCFVFVWFWFLVFLFYVFTVLVEHRRFPRLGHRFAMRIWNRARTRLLLHRLPRFR